MNYILYIQINVLYIALKDIYIKITKKFDHLKSLKMFCKKMERK
jgi:hypothetical protein